MSTGRQLLEELRRDEELRHRELRRAMLIAISREMATKEDVEGLKSDMEALRKEIEGLRREMATKDDVEKLRAYVDVRMDSLDKRIDDLGQRVSDLYDIVKTSLLAIVVTLASTILTPLILRLLLRL